MPEVLEPPCLDPEFEPVPVREPELDPGLEFPLEGALVRDSFCLEPEFEPEPVREPEFDPDLEFPLDGAPVREPLAEAEDVLEDEPVLDPDDLDSVPDLEFLL